MEQGDDMKTIDYLMQHARMHHEDSAIDYEDCDDSCTAETVCGIALILSVGMCAIMAVLAIIVGG